VARDKDDSLRITSASRPRSADIAGRQRRYLISMGIRTLCVVLAVVFMGHWIMWVFAVGAIFLPYIAVVAANAGNPDPGGNDYEYRPDLPMIERGSEQPER
jgi:Flp pilus assembly protein TadB